MHPDQAKRQRDVFEDLHAHPELGFEEHRTASIVARELRLAGVDDIHEGIGGTGVVGVLEGTSPEGPTIALRADMDALPITEASGLAYASSTFGIMHACGHDAHTSILLGAACLLQPTRPFAGRVLFVFQPAEEGLGGARRMIDEGLFDRFPFDECYALHNKPQSRSGLASIRPGPMMAGAVFFDVVLETDGGHAARPDLTRDVLLAGADLVNAIQAIVSRDVPPTSPCVISCTKFQAGTAYNVLPSHAAIGGTIRYFDEAVLALAARRLDEIRRSVGARHGLRVSLEMRPFSPPLVNDDAAANHFAAAAEDVLGPSSVDRSGAQSMGAEDFSEMLSVVPGALLYLHHGCASPLHSPRFAIDPAILPSGSAIFARLVERRMPLGGHAARTASIQGGSSR